ncbi:MAG: mandelate racemase/muconate lactonizing enzyme family protein [Nitrospinales bacterium]
MKLSSLGLVDPQIPFKTFFKHASASRSRTESVIAIAKSESGLKGYGEGCPRSYVTGESINSVLEFVEFNLKNILNTTSFIDLRNWVNQNQDLLDKNPSAWCAVELAILDLLAKEENKSVEGLLSLNELSDSFQYTGVLGVNSYEAFKKQIFQYREIGFSDFKIKVSGDFEEDFKKISLLKNQNIPNFRVRLDANNLWKNPTEAIKYIRCLDFPFFAIEEPLVVEDYEGGLKVFEALDIPIILDESFRIIQQFDHILQTPEAWIINLRISKMGGILRSISILQEAEKKGIPVIVGAQVGETSILTRAALTVVNAFRKIIIAQEGAFGTLLLERDIVDEPLMFGPQGKLSISWDTRTPGFGLEINNDNLI